jgi:Tol biopolymer transport system component
MTDLPVKHSQVKGQRALFWIIGAMLLLAPPLFALAQEAGKPEYVIVVVPVMWSGDLALFQEAAREETSHFINESQIERYAVVRVEIVTENLTGVSLSNPDLPELIQRHALPLASGDRYIGLTDGDLVLDGASSVVGWTRLGGSAIVAEIGYSITTAHELGHTYNLCDEYAYYYWSRQDNLLPSGCPNPYPDNCPRIPAPSVVCEGFPASDGSPSIMGPAMGPHQRFNDPSLIHLRAVFEQLFGTPAGPTPTPAPNETPLPTATPRPTVTPIPSPPPQRLLVSASIDESTQLFMVTTDAEKNQPEQLTTGAGPVVHGSWAPDGRHVVYAAGHTGQLALYTLEIDTRQERLLIEGGLLTHPAWSPTGEVIAFASDRDGELALYTIKPNGSELRRLTPVGIEADWPAWSPDAARLAYASNRSGDWEIYHQAYDHTTGMLGSDMVQLTQSPGKDVMPAWSPNGLHIAFVSERDAMLQIYIMPITADELARVTHNQFNDWGPVWLDGTHILFHSFRGQEMGLYQINWQQRNETPVTINLRNVTWPAIARR